MFIKLIREFLEKRDERKWQEWGLMLKELEFDSSLRLGRVISVRQEARSGTKAYIVWHEKPGDQIAVWVADYWPKKNDFILGSGSIGYGEHHAEPVYYFNNVKRIIRNRVYLGFLKHEYRVREHQK